VAVRLFSPDAKTGGLFVTTQTPSPIVVNPSTLNCNLTFEADTNKPPTFPTPTVGPRALRGYYNATGPATVFLPDGSRNSATVESTIAYFTVRPGYSVRSLTIWLP
jgi:hypothetical protein